MGAEFYFYATTYNGTPREAPTALRQEVFSKGEFRGAHLKPRSPEHAVKLTEPEGTASILDISTIGDEPDYFTASPLTDEELEDYFGSTKPTLEVIKRDFTVVADGIGRGTARYLVAYDDQGKATHYVFMGYSFD